MEAKEAYKALIGYELQYITNPRTSSPEYEPSPELFRDAVIQYSKNTNVRKHYEAFFANTPHTLETGKKRARVLYSELHYLKSEWYVRLLIKELKINRWGSPSVTAEQIDQIIENRQGDMLCQNDRAASKLLYDLALTPIPKIDTSSKNGMSIMRKWANDHENQIPQLLKKKYGDLAVLNSEMVVAVDRKKSSRKRKNIDGQRSPPTRKRPTAPPESKSKQSETSSNSNNIWILLSCLIASGALCVYIYRRSSDQRH